ncbi:MAG: zinc ribbon domain-containing protein [Ignavibacteriaceae bacterium]|jgi:hypothetical protein|nr:zinc ribbon domain-containing protein [Ignavibacteriaceae bacterium]
MYCTQCGKLNLDKAVYCAACGALLDKDETITSSSNLNRPLSQGLPKFINNSGQGSMALLPPELSGWNWGAFFLTWIWGIGNNTWIALLSLIPLVNIVMIFILGAKGNEWAWQNKRWDSVDHFKHVQKLWGIWGAVIFFASIIFALMIIVLAVIVGSNRDTYNY